MIQPDFLVIGAYKSGTTALHHYMRAHPDIFVPVRKEPNYFAFADRVAPFDHPAAADSVRTREEYERLFTGARAGQKLGEVSPAYLTVSSACERIQATAPRVRLIAVLRNPVERSYSDYLMYRRKGLEHEERFVDALRKQADRDGTVDPTGHYISTGLYFEQLAPYFKTFEPSQLLVVLHEELSSDRDLVLRDIFSFIGVDPAVAIEEQAPSNVSGVPNGLPMRVAYGVRNRFGNQLRHVVPPSVKRRLDTSLERRLTREPLPPDARAWLSDLYRPDVEKLARLIDRDLSSWLH